MTETPEGDPTTVNPDRVVTFEDGDTGMPEGGEGGPQDEQGGQQMFDTAAAAEQLGVTEEALIAALGDPEQGPPDFEAAAEALGVTEADLLAALGVSTDN